MVCGWLVNDDEGLGAEFYLMYEGGLEGSSLRLPRLSIEFWLTSIILAITTEAGRPLATDNFIDLLQKIGYAPI